jgi:hypothetical protein
MPTLPMSCKGADLNNIWILESVRNAANRGCPRKWIASARTYCWVRRIWFPVSESRVSASEAIARMVTSWIADTSRVRRSTCCSRNSFLSRRKSAADFSASCALTRASRIAGLIGLVM